MGIRVMALVSSLLLSACSVVGVRTTEEPPYQTVAKLGRVEIRQYGPRLAAETVVDGGEVAARSTGFQRLAGYIFGANRGTQGIAMTAPVAQSSAQPPKSETIAMTAPVDQAKVSDGRWRIRFFMPPKYTRETLPQPTNPKVEIVTVPEATVAVLRYSGIASASAVRDADARLLKALATTEWHPVGTPVSWFYDPPWTLPPFRRNEAVVPVGK